MTIKVLKRAEIDDDKWNNSIVGSNCNNIYGLTWYLDAVTDKNWQALVANDYEIILPFLKKWKYFIPYITQPFLCQSFHFYTKKKKY